PVYRQYVWEYQGIRHLAIHGHQFDRFVINNLLLSRVGEFIYLHLQKIDHKSKAFVRFLDRLNTRCMRPSDKVTECALAYAHDSNAQRVFCGHTHDAMQAVRDGIYYDNCGSWVDSRCTYITVGEEGVNLHDYEERPDDRGPSEEREQAVAEAAG